MTDFSTGCWARMPVMSVKEPPTTRWSSPCSTRLIWPCSLLFSPAWKSSVFASLRYANGAEPKAATIASNEPAWLKNSLTEATSVMSMPGEELRELAKVRVANDMAFHRGVGEASGNTFMMKLWPVLEAEMTPVLAVEHEQRHDYSRAYALHESLV